MVFSSLLFLFRFLPLVFIAYFIVPKKWRNLVLFIFSLIFYAWGEPVYVVLILLSTVVDYTAGRVVFASKEKGNTKRAKTALLFSVIINLSLLGVFKYADFAINTLNAITSLDIATLELSLPIGISFYTFQTMSYTIDVYRGDAKVQKNFISFGAYVSLFPQLIAGPIVRYQTIAEEMNNRTITAEDFACGAKRFIVGLGKKVLIANQVGAVWSEISAADDLTFATSWLGILAFTLQIYFDFSGYSDMAIGLGRMFGFHFLENFEHPYQSKSITEFWRRWHISLGTWFREYVYIPLGGNRKGLVKQIRNLVIVWFLTGLWHGASWNFVIWGLYYGLLLIIEKVFLLKLLDKLPKFVRCIYTLFFVMLGWAIFSYGDMADGLYYIGSMFGIGGVSAFDDYTLYMLSTNAVVIVIAVIGSTTLVQSLCNKLFKEGTLLREIMWWIFIVAVFALCVAMLVNSSYNPFLYFRF